MGVLSVRYHSTPMVEGKLTGHIPEYTRNDREQTLTDMSERSRNKAVSMICCRSVKTHTIPLHTSDTVFPPGPKIDSGAGSGRKMPKNSPR